MPKVRKHYCDQCGASFSNNQGLKVHITRIHKVGNSENITGLVCGCGKEFKTSHGLSIHAKRCSKAPQEQNESKKETSLKGKRGKNNLFQVSDDGTYSCPFCNYVSPTPAGLSQHCIGQHDLEYQKYRLSVKGEPKKAINKFQDRVQKRISKMMPENDDLSSMSFEELLSLNDVLGSKLLKIQKMAEQKLQERLSITQSV